MPLKLRPQFMNSSPGKSVRPFITWETQEDLMLVLRVLGEATALHIMGCEFDFAYRNCSLYFAMGVERNACQTRLMGLEQSQETGSQSD